MPVRPLLSPRLLWRLLAVAFMFGSAYSFGRFLAAVASISGVTGLSAYTAILPRMRREAGHWEALSFALPFVAAVALTLATGSGRSAEDRSSRILNYFADLQWRRPLTIVVIYVLNVAVSFLGSAVCLLLMTLIVYSVYKLR